MKNTITTILFLISGQIFPQNTVTRIEENRFIGRKDNKFGVTDSLKNVIVEFDYDFISYKNQRLVITKNRLTGLSTVDNQELIPIVFDHIMARKHDRFILLVKNSRFGLSDNDGKILLPITYKQISSIANDEVYITKNNDQLNGLYDFNGKNILPEAYKFYTVDDSKIFAMHNNKPQIIDVKNLDNIIFLEESIAFVETTRHSSMGEKFFQIVKSDNKFGVINVKNEIIIPFNYDEIKSSQNWRYFLIKQNNKWGLIHFNGTIVKNPIYDKIELRKEYIVLKRKNFKDQYYSYEY